MFKFRSTPQVDHPVLAENPPMRLKRCRHGLMMYNRNDEYIGHALDFYGEFSELENTLFQSILKPGMVAVDVGANIGVHTINFAKAVTSSGRVFAFEPQRIVHQMLCGNVALNSIGNVAAFLMALGKKAGTIYVPPVNYDERHNFGGVSLGGATGEPVPLLTLDAMNLPSCHFIKIDVEGMEQDVLEGTSQTIAKFKPALYVENDRVERSVPLLRCMMKYGYQLYWSMPPLFNPDNFFGRKENLYPILVSCNVLAIPRNGNFSPPQNAVEITEANLHQHPLTPS